MKKTIKNIVIIILIIICIFIYKQLNKEYDIEIAMQLSVVFFNAPAKIKL